MSDVANVSETLRIAEMELARIYEISGMDFGLSRNTCARWMRWEQCMSVKGKFWSG